MQNLTKQIHQLQQTPVKHKIKLRLSEFDSFKHKTSEEWFSELCFCILTANSKAKTALKIQSEIGNRFLTMSPDKIKKCIIKNRHRFHNNKTKYILQARTNKNIKEKINALLHSQDEKNAREWLVKNIKGIGYKEASHFLRNTGSKNIAILDRHILNIMHDNGIIQKPKSLNKKNYLQIEEKFKQTAKQMKMTMAELDLYLWFIQTGQVLK